MYKSSVVEISFRAALSNKEIAEPGWGGSADFVVPGFASFREV